MLCRMLMNTPKYKIPEYDIPYYEDNTLKYAINATYYVVHTKEIIVQALSGDILYDLS